VAPTIIARDRVAGAKLARDQGASVIVMDDGLQNPSLAKDLRLALIDARRGIGNGRTFPAGPLRAPLDAQLAQIDALLVVGKDAGTNDIITQARARGLQVLRGRLTPDPVAVKAFKGRDVLAFAGIGDPEKFFATAVSAGIPVKTGRPFPDHYRYTAEDTEALITRAEHDGLVLLTTEKDRARMTGERLLAAFANRVQVLPVTMEIEEANDLRGLIMSKLRR
jgi:tetraacyldisaccharide 4'-kinase